MRMLAHEEVDDRTRIAFPDARTVMLAAATPLEAESVTLLVANGRVAARTLRAAQDIVPFARSIMDGYALRAADTYSASRGAPRALRVTSATYAGDPPISLTVGQAVAVATGSPLPAGADAVAPFETSCAIRSHFPLRSVQATTSLCAATMRSAVTYSSEPARSLRRGALHFSPPPGMPSPSPVRDI